MARGEFGHADAGSKKSGIISFLLKFWQLARKRVSDWAFWTERDGRAVAAVRRESAPAECLKNQSPCRFQVSDMTRETPKKSRTTGEASRSNLRKSVASRPRLTCSCVTIRGEGWGDLGGRGSPEPWPA